VARHFVRSLGAHASRADVPDPSSLGSSEVDAPDPLPFGLGGRPCPSLVLRVGLPVPLLLVGRSAAF
jgi:hypothetical protein